MDSSPESESGSDHAPVTLEDRNLSYQGRFNIPKKETLNIDINHKDLGVFKIEDIPFTKPIYVAEGGVRSTVESHIRKALEIEEGESVDIELVRVIKTNNR